MPKAISGSMVVFALVLGGQAFAQQAVVMKDGAVVKCQKFEAKGNVYVITMPDGKLQSVRADKVDADATAGWAEKMKAQEEAEAALKQQTTGEKAPGDAVSLTNDDLKKYKGISLGDQTTVTAEGAKMPDRKDYEAAGKKEEPAPAPTPQKSDKDK
ncbi:MAG: hypothetical protein U0166_02030 [Acidobacteriota bacterium]